MTEEELQKIKEHIEIHARKEPAAVIITQILWKAVEELEATKELQKQIEKMKCCENCGHQKVYQDYYYCELKDCARIHHSKWELKE